MALGSLSQIWATLSRSWETQLSTTNTERDWPSGFSGEQHATPLSDHDFDDNHCHGKGSNAVFIAPAPMLFLPACSVSQNDANIRPGALSSRRARLTSMHTNYPSSFFWLFSSSAAPSPTKYPFHIFVLALSSFSQWLYKHQHLTDSYNC